MSLQPDALKREIEKAIASLAEEKGTDFAAKIRTILYASLDRKRLQKFVEDDPAAVKEYVDRVVEKYGLFNSYIHQLQIEKSNELWATLLKDMRTWAYRNLTKWGCNANQTTWENAGECASEAARIILGTHFPFDTDFEPWARVVVRYTCLKFLRSSAKAPPIVEESLENLEGILRSSGNPGFSAEHPELFEAMNQLTEIRRQVIEMKYFQGLSASEIASKIGKSARAVHSLQFRALEDLRKILRKNRNKFNE